MIRKSLFIAFCGLLAMGHVALGKESSPKATNTIHLTSTDLQDIDDLMNGALKLFDVPGAALGIVVGGEVVVCKGYGYRDISKKAPVTPDTLFAIGSCTKAFTAFVLGQLVDEGEISWDDPIIKYIPEFHLHDQHATCELTIRDLLAHRSGLPHHDLCWYNAPISRSEILNRLRYLEPNCDLREKFQYNNLMYLVAGIVIERVTGLKWEEAVKTRILLPLKMMNTNFSPEESQKSADFSFPYMKKEKGVSAIPFRNICNVGPAGSMNSSISDMMKWAMLNLSDGTLDNTHFINKGTLQEMHTLQIASTGYPEEPLHTLGYGLGWFIGMYRGQYCVQHGGVIDGFISTVAILPQKKIGVVILTNSVAEGFHMAEAVLKSVADKLLKTEGEDWLTKIKKQYDDLMGEKEETLQSKGSPSHPLKDYAGSFSHPGYGSVRVSLEKNQLVLTFNRIVFPLVHKCYDTFVASKESRRDLVFPVNFDFSFVANSSGEITELRIPFEPALDPIVFHREVEGELASRDYLKQFDGLYQGALGTFQILLKGDHLVAIVPGHPPGELVAEKPFVFSVRGLQGLNARFEKNALGKVTEVVVMYSGSVYRFKKQ